MKKITGNSVKLIVMFLFIKSQYSDGTIIRTGTPCYMRELACRWCIAKKGKTF